ncbi:siderophore-interacting protein [Streptomyces sp. NBC_01476]|uniref:siderophore-interacting protein n=1 Tax=Streptomyces sp. NBC_01476 TaxID=2903881 RepID=UPI002E30EA51|nr:siderophore-interacting protein [Streptomyces sp. NBC_01476]
MSQMPYGFFHPRVVRVEHVSPTLRRVVLGGQEIAGVVSGGLDQRLKIFLPHPGQDAPVLPDVLDLDWYARWRQLDPDVRGIMRTYTVRAVRQDPPELDIDFALHGDLGPASRWAQHARPGDRLSLLAPVVADNGGVDFRPPEDTDWILLTADVTALPALAAILGSLPPGTPVRAFIGVPHPDDRIALPTEADARISWDPADLTTAAFPPGTPYAWLAGEAATVRGQRRHLVNDRGFSRAAVTFSGYWRRGTTEDDLLEAAAAEAAA